MKKILLFGFLISGVAQLMFHSHLAAQERDLPSEQIEVIRSFEARLMDAEKLRLSPTIPGPDTTRVLTYDYTLSSRPLAVTYTEPDIRPIGMRKESLPEPYNGFLRAGYGFPNSPLLEAGYHLDNQSNMSMAITGRHLSAKKDDIPNQRFRDTHVALSGQYVLSPYFTVATDVSYDINDYYYYALHFLEDSTINENVKKRYQNLSAQAKISNSQPTENHMDYFASIKLNHLTDNRASRENNLDLTFGATKWLDETHPFSLELGLEFTGLKDTLTRHLNNFYLKPTFTWVDDRFSIMAGLNLSSSSDEFYFFPLAEASYKIAGHTLVAFAGIDGDLYKNNYTNLSSYNPFINHRLDSLGNSSRTKIYGGVKGLYRQFTYSAEVRYQSIERMAFYLPNENLPYLFDPIFDESKVYTGEITLAARINDNIRLQTQATLNLFRPETEEEAWHIPALVWNFGGMYNSLDQKFQLKANLFVESGIQYRDEEGDTESLSGLFDLNLSADYFFNDHLAAFVSLQNIFNNKRQRWVNYPSFGINAHAGVFLRF